MPKLKISGLDAKWYKYDEVLKKYALISVSDYYRTTVDDIGHTIKAIYYKKKSNKQHIKTFKIKMPIKMRIKLDKYLKSKTFMYDGLYIDGIKHTLHFDQRIMYIVLFDKKQSKSYMLSDIQVYPIDDNSVLMSIKATEDDTSNDIYIETNTRFKRDLFIILIRELCRLWTKEN